MDAAFDAVHEDIRILGIKLQLFNSELLSNKSNLPAAERTAHYICQQCEASLQFLLSLCHQKLFRDRLLRNKVVYSRRCILFMQHFLQCSLFVEYIPYISIPTSAKILTIQPLFPCYQRMW